MKTPVKVGSGELEGRRDRWEALNFISMRTASISPLLLVVRSKKSQPQKVSFLVFSPLIQFYLSCISSAFNASMSRISSCFHIIFREIYGFWWVVTLKNLRFCIVCCFGVEFNGEAMDFCLNLYGASDSTSTLWD